MLSRTISFKRDIMISGVSINNLNINNFNKEHKIMKGYQCLI